MERVTPPIDRPDQIVPFTDDQLRGLLKAARKSTNPRRAEAIRILRADALAAESDTPAVSGAIFR